MQRTMNARINRKVRNGKGAFIGMEVPVLNTVARCSGQPRGTPVAWFGDDDDAWLRGAPAEAASTPAGTST
jgi:hypothetical protein